MRSWNFIFLPSLCLFIIVFCVFLHPFICWVNGNVWLSIIPPVLLHYQSKSKQLVFHVNWVNSVIYERPPSLDNSHWRGAAALCTRRQWSPHPTTPAESRSAAWTSWSPWCHQAKQWHLEGKYNRIRERKSLTIKDLNFDFLKCSFYCSLAFIWY